MRHMRALTERHLTKRPTRSRPKRILAGLAILGLAAGLSTALTAGALPASAAVSGNSDPITYSYTGSPTAVTVPQGVQMAFIQATGGSGGNATMGAVGGLGATVDGAFYVTPGEQLQLAVGQAGLTGAPGWGTDQYFGGTPGASGWNNSTGPVDAGGGGGATVVSTGTGPVIVAAGGGGGGASAHDSSQYPSEPVGGDGGAGGATSTNGATGAGGTADGAGIGGAAGGSDTVSGGDGSTAVTWEGGTFGQGGGGGGGSALGGAGGATGTGTTGFGGGGGGGGGQSSTVASVFDTSVATAGAAGDGSITLTWIGGTTLTTMALPARMAASATPQPLSVTAKDQSNETLPDPSAFVTWSSSDHSDVFSAAGVVMTHVGSHTITASWNGDPTTSSSFTVNVAPGPIAKMEFVSPIPQYRTVSPNTLVLLGVEGTDAWGNLVGDATSDVTFTSTVASDVFSTVSPGELTMTAPGTHVITASYPGFPSATITLVVTASMQHLDTTTPPPGGSREFLHRPDSNNDTETSNGTSNGTETSTFSDTNPVASTRLATTGRSAPTGLLIVALAMAAAGIALSWIAISLRRPRRRRS